MAPGGRAGFRGGSRGRGGFRGRGRGRGKAVAQQPRSARFDNARLASKEEYAAIFDHLPDYIADIHSESESGSENVTDESDFVGVDSEDDDDEETKPTAQPYMNLMRSLAQSAPHKAKRRKLNHTPTTDPGPSNREAPTEPIQDEKLDQDEDEDQDVDLAEEPEEDPADAAPEDLFDEDDDLDSSDPFEVHFSEPKENVLQPRLKAIQEGKWDMERITANSTRIYLNTPKTGDARANSLPASVSGISDLKLKRRLHETMAPKHSSFDDVQRSIAPLLFNYQDLLYCNRTVAASQSIRRMACLHALNHIYKCAA